MPVKFLLFTIAITIILVALLRLPGRCVPTRRGARGGFFQGNCPCCDVCTITADDFDDDHLASDYTIDSGSWTVASGVLTTASTDALIWRSTGGGSGDGTIAVTIKCGSTTDQARVYIDGTSGQRWFMQVQAGSTNGTLTLYEVVAGVPTQRHHSIVILGYTAGETLSARFCFVLDVGGKGRLVANATYDGVTVAQQYVDLSPTSLAGLGLGTGTVGTLVTFDDLVITRHGDVLGTTIYFDQSAPYEDCPACEYPLDSADPCHIFVHGTVPAQFTVTLSAGFANIGGGCVASCATVYDGASYTVSTPDAVFGKCGYDVTAVGCNGTDTIQVIFSLGRFGFGSNPTNVYITVIIGNGGVSPAIAMQWDKDLGATQIDGSTLNEVVATAFGSAGCNHAGTTATVTTV